MKHKLEKYFKDYQNKFNSAIKIEENIEKQLKMLQLMLNINILNKLEVEVNMVM